MLLKLISHYNLKKLYLVKQQFQNNVLLVGSDLIYQTYLVLLFFSDNSFLIQKIHRQYFLVNQC